MNAKRENACKELMLNNEQIRAPTLALSLLVLVALSANALGQTGGMFGPRVLGAPLQPGVSQFGGGLQISPNGTFVGTGRTNGANQFATPWRRSTAPLPYISTGYAVLPNGQLTAITPDGNLAAVAAVPAPTPLQPAVPIETTVPPEVSVVGPPAPALSPAVSPNPVGGATADTPAPQPARQLVTGATTAQSELNGYLPRVSERLTRIARSHGIRVASPIRVSVVNGTAILRGVVGSPHGSALIANLAGLEPGVERVSNQLTVASEAVVPE